MTNRKTEQQLIECVKPRICTLKKKTNEYEGVEHPKEEEEKTKRISLFHIHR